MRTGGYRSYDCRKIMVHLSARIVPVALRDWSFVAGESRLSLLAARHRFDCWVCEGLWIMTGIPRGA